MVQVYLTRAQINKMKKGLAFQVNATNMNKQPNIEVHLPKKGETVFNRNRRNGKGYRFSEYAPDMVDGDGFSYGDCDSMDDASDEEDLDDDDDIEGGRFSLKRFTRSVKKQANNGFNQVKKTAGNYIADEIENRTGMDVRNRNESLKKLKSLGKSTARTGIRAGVGTFSGAFGTELGGPVAGIVAAKLADKYISDPLIKKSSLSGDGFRRGFTKGIRKQIRRDINIDSLGRGFIDGGAIVVPVMPRKKLSHSLAGGGSEYIEPRDSNGNFINGNGISGYSRGDGISGYSRKDAQGRGISGYSRGGNIIGGGYML